MLSSLEELYIVLLWIIPGFLGYTAFRIISIDEKERAEFDKIVYVLLYSLVSYQIINTFVFHIASFEDIKTYLFEPVFTLSIFSTALVLGSLAGATNRYIFQRQILPKDCWFTFQRKVKREWVTVYTKDGLEIKGVLNYISCEYVDKELIITNPERIVRDDKMEITSYLPLGEEMYFNKDDISRIAFRVHF